MRTISVDDRQLIVDMMLRILNEVDGAGEYLGTTNANETLARPVHGTDSGSCIVGRLTRTVRGFLLELPR